jgi:hypothetical protein
MAAPQSSTEGRQKEATKLQQLLNPRSSLLRSPYLSEHLEASRFLGRKGNPKKKDHSTGGREGEGSAGGACQKMTGYPNRTLGQLRGEGNR